MNNDFMFKKRVKTTLQLICEFLVIWYGMGTPIPTSVTEGIKLAVAIIAVAYTGWKNHDFTPEACEGTGLTHLLKRMNNQENYSGEVFTGEDGEVEDESRNIPSVR